CSREWQALSTSGGASRWPPCADGGRARGDRRTALGRIRLSTRRGWWRGRLARGDDRTAPRGIRLSPGRELAWQLARLALTVPAALPTVARTRESAFCHRRRGGWHV